MNQDLIKDIESAGGEAIITPYHDYVKITIENVLRRSVMRGEYLESGMNRVLIRMFRLLDDRYYKPFTKLLGPAPTIVPRDLEKNLKFFNIDKYHSGESYDNILKIFYLAENFPEISLFVQTNPAYCCPSLVTEAMTHKIKEITGIPVITITYDGTSAKMNDAIVPYIHSAERNERNKSDRLQFADEPSGD
jgi:predicted nucleotide-binding protein (sugar kinase/HSP70/actin superfamily)